MTDAPATRHQATQLTRYYVHGRMVRWFHWINFVCILALIAIGTVIIFSSDLGITPAGEIALRTVHVSVGYVFAINLAWRCVWAFIGPASARWRALLPCGAGFLGELKTYMTALRAGHPPPCLGHTPPGRIAITALLTLLTIQAMTGLVLAGTDIFYPPFGAWIAQSVAAPGVDPATLIPKDMTMVDKPAWEAMRAWREPIATIHGYNFYAILAAITVHIAGVVVTDVVEKTGLISSMFSGWKTLSGPPVDGADF